MGKINRTALELEKLPCGFKHSYYCPCYMSLIRQGQLGHIDYLTCFVIDFKERVVHFEGIKFETKEKLLVGR